ncbi:MAG TPA: YbgC/FadM family acyl-CoA thioesterase [Nitrospinota bacterium]|nr:YbgC/FadM family acyl-CoA thioesterase [Nitrospinota bacterium]|tara:strand:+ start:3417 stop:3812 length:396 start_codon:yes stop_codon:yes gene_type:complete
MSQTKVEVFYEDTDCGQVVYYANYLRYFERARTHYFKELDVDLAKWAAGGVTFTVYRAEIDYKSPAVYGEILTVLTDLEETKGSRLIFSYKVTSDSDERVNALGITKMACVGENGKPRRIPDEIIQVIGNR